MCLNNHNTWTHMQRNKRVPGYSPAVMLPCLTTQSGDIPELRKKVVFCVCVCDKCPPICSKQTLWKRNEFLASPAIISLDQPKNRQKVHLFMSTKKELYSVCSNSVLVPPNRATDPKKIASAQQKNCICHKYASAATTHKNEKDEFLWKLLQKRAYPADGLADWCLQVILRLLQFFVHLLDISIALLVGSRGHGVSSPSAVAQPPLLSNVPRRLPEYASPDRFSPPLLDNLCRRSPAPLSLSLSPPASSSSAFYCLIETRRGE